MGKSRNTTYRAPGAFGNTMKNSVPSITNQTPTKTRIVHTEYVQDITSSGNPFACTTFNINPGLSNIFPWLASIAQGFECYRFRKLLFIYKPKCASTSTGTVLFAFDPDAADSPPATKAIAMTGPFSDANVWAPMTFSITPQNLSKYKERFIRLTDIPNTDIKTYDVGLLNLITQGSGSSAITLGELHVHYVVDLMSPQVNTSSFNSIFASQTFVNSLSALTAPFGSISSAVQYYAANPWIYTPATIAALAGGSYLIYNEFVGNGSGSATMFPTYNLGMTSLLSSFAGNNNIYDSIEIVQSTIGSYIGYPFTGSGAYNLTGVISCVAPYVYNYTAFVLYKQLKEDLLAGKFVNKGQHALVDAAFQLESQLSFRQQHKYDCKLITLHYGQSTTSKILLDSDKTPELTSPLEDPNTTENLFINNNEDPITTDDCSVCGLDYTDCKCFYDMQ
jgi:hypothetical protein